VPDKCTLDWPDGKYDARIHRAYPKKPPTLSSHEIVVNLDTEETLGSSAKRLEYSFKPFQAPQLRNRRASNSHGFGLSLSPAGPEAFLQMLLPEITHIWKLVDYHELYLLWYHGCYHGPTFRSELQSILPSEPGNDTLDISGVDLQWLALLFSIMAGSLTCTTDRRLEQWRFSKSEVVKLSMQWYKASIFCLNQAEWTMNHSIYSVHAIATLTMSAHPLGRSSELSVLLGAAVKIAQSLGLDRLDHAPVLESIDASSSEEQRYRLLQREIGRRVWSQLCVQDWMSLPFTESHSISPLDFSTTKPSSRDHLTMEPIPSTFPTYVSYGNYLFEIAKLMVGHHEATLRSTTPYTKYEQVLEYDARMRMLATKGMPRYFHVVEPIDRSWPEWVPWARQSLTICFAHKMIMIHRNFIRQSFTNPAHSMTRTTCVAAAKTILNEAKQAKDLDGPIIWVDKAFCVVAGMVLCLDIFHRSDSDPEFKSHKELVIDCIQSLSRYDTSTIAMQGAKVLTYLLAERDKVASSLTWPPQVIDLSRLLHQLETEAPFCSRSEPRSISIPQLLPPQAGFRNNFIFDHLLQFGNNPPWT
jgi:hypothetical protein